MGCFIMNNGFFILGSSSQGLLGQANKNVFAKYLMNQKYASICIRDCHSKD